MKRIFVIVLDSFGIGAARDAAAFGDATANTLSGIAKTGKLHVPTLTSLGLGNVDGVDAIARVDAPLASIARLREKSNGKDTTTGHWELMGLVSEHPMPTYPEGFPQALIDAFEAATGYGVLCNRPYSGTDVIRDYGKAHLETGKLIVYTSADSVFQIAAHEDLVPTEKLYEICRTARALLQGEHAVGRVIARPFTGTPTGGFVRTQNRRDFSLVPPEDTMLDHLLAMGYDTIGVGKIGDIFAMKGLSASYPTHNNDEGMQKAMELLETDFNGLCFVNLVDFDMVYGHRQDADGYAGALSRFDAWLAGFLAKLGEEDALIITADHGCDPTDESTDHTREDVPMLLFGKALAARNLGTLHGFDTVGKTVVSLLKGE